MKSLRIVHLSDLHVNKAYESNYQKYVLSPLLQCLSVENTKKKIDLICITGDLIDKGGYGYSSIVDAFTYFDTFFLNQLIKTIGIKKENIIICPGNHDIDRKKDSLPDESLIINNTKDSSQLKQTISAIISGNKTGVHRVDDFKNFETSFYSSITDSNISFFESLHHRIVNNVSVSLLSLNSIWRCYAPQDKLIIGSQQLSNSISKIKKRDINILLSHYDLENEIEYEKKDTQTLASDYFQIQLFGHTHSGKTAKVSLLNGCTYISSVARSLCPDNISSQNIDFQNGFSILDYYSEKNEKYIDFFPKKIDCTGSRFIPDDTVLNSGEESKRIYIYENKKRFSLELPKSIYKYFKDKKIVETLLSYISFNLFDRIFNNIYLYPSYIVSLLIEFNGFVSNQHYFLYDTELKDAVSSFLTAWESFACKGSDLNDMSADQNLIIISIPSDSIQFNILKQKYMDYEDSCRSLEITYNHLINLFRKKFPNINYKKIQKTVDKRWYKEEYDNRQYYNEVISKK